MNGNDDHDHSASADHYVPTRTPRLREGAIEPPPLPVTHKTGRYRDEHDFGAADEDGLRILAALETLTSLEPDYSDDLDFAGEASVTIVNAAGHEIGSAFGAEPSQTALRHSSAYDASGLLLNGYDTFLAPGDEAIVEIVEIAPALDVGASAAPTQTGGPLPTSLTERLAAAAGPGGRFLKALSGG